MAVTNEQIWAAVETAEGRMVVTSQDFWVELRRIADALEKIEGKMEKLVNPPPAIWSTATQIAMAEAAKALKERKVKDERD